MLGKDLFSTHPLLCDDLRLPIKGKVSEHQGRSWQVKTIQDRNDRASHRAALLSDGAFPAFAKFGELSVEDQFAQEVVGLQTIARSSGVLTPVPIANIKVENGTIMILEAVEEVERDTKEWRQIGHAPALLHQAKSDLYGLETHSYWGDIYQDNQPTADWVSFYRNRRLLPRLKMAIDSGHLPLNVAKQVDKVIRRLPELCGPEVQPTLLHEDAHHNNFSAPAEEP